MDFIIIIHRHTLTHWHSARSTWTSVTPSVLYKQCRGGRLFNFDTLQYCRPYRQYTHFVVDVWRPNGWYANRLILPTQFNRLVTVENFHWKWHTKNHNTFIIANVSLWVFCCLSPLTPLSLEIIFHFTPFAAKTTMFSMKCQTAKDDFQFLCWWVCQSFFPYSNPTCSQRRWILFFANVHMAIIYS